VVNDSVTTYRGIRSAGGKKVFGTKVDGNNRLVGSRINDSNTEEVVINIDASSAHSNTLPDWLMKLQKKAEEHGPLVEVDSDSNDVHQEIDQQHLKNLGYLD
jgi:hypothetical protein